MTFICVRLVFAYIAVPLVFLSTNANALVSPYTPPVSYVGGAIGSGIAQTMIRRGFAANDPIILRTVVAASARVAPLAAASGAANWIGVVSRLSPWVTGGVLIYQGVSWYMDNQGKVYLAPPGSTSTAPVFSDGTVAGKLCWGISSDCFGSPQEVMSYVFSVSKAQYKSSVYGVPQLVSNSATQWTATYNYSIPELSLKNMSGSKNIFSHLANFTCPQGYGYPGSGTGCVSASLNSSPYAGAPLVGTKLQDAFDALPQPAKAAPMSKELLTELVKQIWRDAAAQPGYQGAPYSELNPPSVGDFEPYAKAHPDVWPKTVGLVDPVPTVPATDGGPIVWPDAVLPMVLPPTTTTTTTTGTSTDPAGNKSTTTSSSVTDWGQFAAPDLDTPTVESILDPLFAMWPSWQGFAFPAHQSSCPTPSFRLPASVIGGMNVQFVELCQWVETVRPGMQAAFAVAWAILIVFIVMGA